MKHEVSGQPNINSDIINQSIIIPMSDPLVLKFITIHYDLRNNEAN